MYPQRMPVPQPVTSPSRLRTPSVSQWRGESLQQHLPMGSPQMCMAPRAQYGHMSSPRSMTRNTHFQQQPAQPQLQLPPWTWNTSIAPWPTHQQASPCRRALVSTSQPQCSPQSLNIHRPMIPHHGPVQNFSPLTQPSMSSSTMQNVDPVSYCYANTNQPGYQPQPDLSTGPYLHQHSQHVFCGVQDGNFIPPHLYQVQGTTDFRCQQPAESFDELGMPY